MGREIVADSFVGKGVHPERLGIVSGKSRVFEIAGDMEDESQFAHVRSLTASVLGAGDKIDPRAEGLQPRRRVRRPAGINVVITQSVMTTVRKVHSAGCRNVRLVVLSRN